MINERQWFSAALGRITHRSPASSGAQGEPSVATPPLHGGSTTQSQQKMKHPVARQCNTQDKHFQPQVAFRLISLNHHPPPEVQQFTCRDGSTQHCSHQQPGGAGMKRQKNTEARSKSSTHGAPFFPLLLICGVLAGAAL